MLEPLVSVVIPVYNVEKYLNRCVESVVSQTYNNMEIILVDDGSTDSCPVICDAWADKDRRIKVVHKQNAGLGMARNTGINNANGKYIFFFDSDDYVDFSTLRACVATAIEKNAQMVCFLCNDVYDDGRIDTNKSTLSDITSFKQNELLNVLLPSMLTYKLGVGISACMKLFDLEVIKQNNIRFLSEREIISEDTVFVMDYMLHTTSAAVLPQALYYYYKREHSLTRTICLDRQQKNDAFCEFCNEYIENKGLPDIVKFNLAARYHMYTLGALKQIVAAEIPKKEKNNLLKNIYKSPVLKSTLNSQVLRCEKRNLKLFFGMIKYRMFFVCNFLLSVKMH